MIKTVINRTITTTMIYMAVVLVGLLAVLNIPRDLFPEMSMPYVIVYSSYSSAGPSEIESLVTKTLESSLSSVSDLKEMTSQSGNGYAMIMLEFSDNVDMDMAALNVREKVDLVKNYLPDGASAPMIMKVNPSQMAIMNFSVSSEKYDIVKLNSFVEDNVIPRLEKINGVAEITASGGKEREIRITAYPEKMQAYGLSTAAISGVLASENLNLPGGTLLEGEKDITVRTIGEFASIEDIKNIPLQTPYGTIYLRDVAEVTDTYKDLSSFAYVNGKESIAISVQKQSVANTVDVCTKIVEELNNIENEYEGTISFKMTYDSAEYINASISSVGSSALVGGLLAVIVLYVFLRNIWPTLVIATSIPTSILATFMLMYLADMSLNMVTLGSLTIAIGMLVDASIVVLENIDVHRKKGKTSKEAAYDGAKEVMLAVFASTLTSIVVFLPFIFTSGSMMQMLHVFAWVIMFALAASIITSITLVPMLSSKLPEKRKEVKSKWLRNITNWFKEFLEKVEEKYEALLTYSLDNKKKVLKLTGILVLISLVCFSLSDKALFPESDEGIYSITITMPEGTTIDKTLEMAINVSEKIENLKGIKDITMSAGGGSVLSAGGSNAATISVDIGDAEDRNFSVDDAVSEARKIVQNISGAEFEVASSGAGMMAMMSSGATLTLTGDENDRLHEIADELVKRFSEIDGLVEVKKGITEGTKEARIEIDRNRLSLYGLSTAQVATSIQTAITGTKATTLKIDGDEIDVVIEVDDTSVKYIKDLSNIFVTSQTTGANIPLTEVGNIVIDKTASTIVRTNQKQTLTVEAELDGIALSEAQEKIEKSLSTYNMPDGYSYSWGGSMEMMIDSFKSLITAIIMAIILVYMVMASQFETLFDPFIIMFTIPIAFAGSFIGIFLTGSDLTVIAVMGMIVLVGIVVNNGIILIDFIIQERARGTDINTATIMSGKQRLRPILMATLTTILGMVPMALETGSGSEMQGLAIVVIFGLTTSTLLTLFLIPVLYVGMNTRLEKAREKKKSMKKDKEIKVEEKETKEKNKISLKIRKKKEE